MFSVLNVIGPHSWAPYCPGVGLYGCLGTRMTQHHLSCILALRCNVAVREAQLRRHFCWWRPLSKPRFGPWSSNI